jgi:hypothetical protein
MDNGDLTNLSPLKGALMNNDENDGDQNGNGIMQEEVLKLLVTITHRLSLLAAWGLIAMAHICAAIAMLFGLWLTGVTPADVVQAAQWLLHTKPATALGAAGVSAVAVLAGYAKFLAWAYAKTHRGWLFGYLTKAK